MHPVAPSRRDRFHEAACAALERLVRTWADRLRDGEQTLSTGGHYRRKEKEMAESNISVACRNIEQVCAELERLVDMNLIPEYYENDDLHFSFRLLKDYDKMRTSLKVENLGPVPLKKLGQRPLDGKLARTRVLQLVRYLADHPGEYLEPMGKGVFDGWRFDISVRGQGGTSSTPGLSITHEFFVDKWKIGRYEID